MVAKVAIRPFETQKWLLFSNYLGNVVKTFRIGAIPPVTKLKWELAAALKEIKEYQISNIKKTENLFFLGYGVEVSW